MKCLPLQDSVVYGPLYSRRLGLSLGVNILPFDRKVCSFNCRYCHFGMTHIHTLSPEGVHYPPISQVLRDIEMALRVHPEIDAITFSGNGEPTLRPQFGEIVREAKSLRDKLNPHTKLALFSNASTVLRAPVQDAIAMIDLPMLKLDAGDERTFQQINQPVVGLTLAPLIEVLQNLPHVIIQSVLVEGVVSNSTGDASTAWLSALLSIHPELVQIYSTDYPVPDAGIERIPWYRLQNIARDMQRAGLNVQAYGI